MAASAGLLTAGAGHPWETAIVAALDRPGAPFSVVRRCADIADVLATASTGQASACLVAADLRRLDTESVEQLRSMGVTVVAVYAAADSRAAARLDRVGVTAMIADDADPAAMVAATAQAVATAGSPQGPARSTAGLGGAWTAGTRQGDRSPAPRPQEDLTGSRPPRARPVADGAGADELPEPPGAATTRGQTIAVWGPVGAPGRSTVAMGLADQWAAAGRSVLLVDADVYGGILANAFGLLDESAGLAGACRLAANGRLDAGELVRLCWTVGPQIAVLTGIARADRWPEVRASAIPAVLEVARQVADTVLIDCAAVLEVDEEISFDTMAPRRNGATLAILDCVDTVLAVGAGDPPGMERLVRGLTELAEVVPGATPAVVLNRLRRTSATAGELRDALRRFARTDALAMLPEDREACDRAWHGGRTLSAVAPRSPLTVGLRELAKALLPAPAVVAAR